MKENPRKFSPKQRTLNVFAAETFRPFPGPTTSLHGIAHSQATPVLSSNHSLQCSHLGLCLHPRAITLQLEQTETHARAHSILRQILSGKTTGNPSHFGMIFPKAFHYTQTKTDLVRLIFRWHLDGCDMTWVWMGDDLVHGTGGSCYLD